MKPPLLLPRWFLLCVAFVVGFNVLSAEDEPLDLKDVMAPDVFARAGLEKLSDEELAILSTWVEAHIASGEEATSTEPPPDLPVVQHIEIPVGDDAFGAEDVRETVTEVFQRAAPDELVSTIPGNFRGWSGKTVFRLSNGQVWKQASSGRFVVNLDDPTVTIERGTFGAYYLSVEGYGSRVGVKRLQ